MKKKTHGHSPLYFVYPLPYLPRKRAVTETGHTVILYDDGTWSYADEEAEEEEPEIFTNPTPFAKGPKATFGVESEVIPLKFFIDPKEWSFVKGTNNEAAEYEFKYKKGELHALAITGKMEIPLTALRKVALLNGQKVAPDLKIVHEEYRVVNGHTVFQLRMEGTTQGIKFAYNGYYYSNEHGTVQLVTYTAQNLMPALLPASEALLNGFSPR